MLPLDDYYSLPRGFRFGQVYPAGFGDLSGKRHIGTDVGNREQYGKSIRAHTDGECQYRNGLEGGLTIHFRDANGVLVRHMHCSALTDAEGPVKAGAVLGYIGNTGLVRPQPSPTDPHAGAHDHTDCSKNGKLELGNFDNFLDPDVYFKQFDTMPTYDDKFIRNITTGAFAYVARGKKQKVTDPGALAILTGLQRDPKRLLAHLIENVQAKVWDSIQDTPTPFFPQ